MIISLFILYFSVAFLYGLMWCIRSLTEHRDMNMTPFDYKDVLAIVVVIVLIMILLPLFLLMDIKYQITIYKEYDLPDYQKSISTYREYKG